MRKNITKKKIGVLLGGVSAEREVSLRSGKAALAAHQALGCSGATRVDLIIDRFNNPYVLEVNTIPGMTETSLLPKIANHAGIAFPQLIQRILGD